METFFERYGGSYRWEGEYRIPNLTLPDEPEYEIGIWGQRRLDYLKKHRKGFYAVLCTSGKSAEHLHEIDVAAIRRRIEANRHKREPTPHVAPLYHSEY